MRLALSKYGKFAAVFIAFAALLAFVLWPQTQATQPQDGAPSTLGWQQAGVANPFTSGSSTGPVPERGADALTTPAPSLASSSLAGTQPDGDWGLDGQGRLRPSRSLRQRMDYYLSLTGEMPLAGIEAVFRQAAEREVKEPALGQVLAIWQRYLQLQKFDWKHAVDLRQPASWSAALSERQIVRRQILGADVAYAFYAEEEAQLQQMLTQVQTGQATPSADPQPASHPQAAEREAAVQAQWQQWEQRLNTARERLRQLHLAPELSAVQRQQAIESYLASQFQGTELVRARALLGV